MKMILNNAGIKAISCVIPYKKIDINEQINIFYSGNQRRANRIKNTIGIKVRHIVDDNTTTLDLCYIASKNLLKHFEGLNIDAILFVTQTPDFLQPNNSHILHGKLGLSENCACIDINQGCSGYVYGLFLAFMMVECGAKNIILCVGDTMSKVVNPIDSNTAPLFGDAGSATLISKNINEKSFFSFHSNGNGWENIVFPNSGFRNNACFTKVDTNRHGLYMDGAEVFNFSVSKEPKSILELLSFSNKKIDDIDYIFFHQANAYIIANISKRLGLSLDKAPIESIGKYGNTSSTSIPMAICDYFGNNSLHTSKNRTLILSGFGVGLSWASCLININSKCLILPISIQGRNNDTK